MKKKINFPWGRSFGLRQGKCKSMRKIVVERGEMLV
jgi:hypothetical protein